MADVIRAFGAVHVSKLTGLSPRQLAYWDRAGFFPPYYPSEDRGSASSRVYSFDDLVGLRLIALLRNHYGISLQKLRNLAKHLSYRHRPWTDLTLYIGSGEVYFKKPGPPPSWILAIAVGKVAAELLKNAAELGQRKPDQIGRVERHRNVVHNAWVLAGTRIPVKAILRYHQAGYDKGKILQEYPQLTRVDIESAISHAQEILKQAS